MIPKGTLVTIRREGEIIFQGWPEPPFQIPRTGETLALAKWDTVYTVKRIFHVFGKSKEAHCVFIDVEIT